jgi:hypothetical protein
MQRERRPPLRKAAIPGDPAGTHTSRTNRTGGGLSVSQSKAESEFAYQKSTTPLSGVRLKTSLVI